MAEAESPPAQPSGNPFPALTRSVLNRPGWWLIGLLVLSLPFAAAIPTLDLRTDGEALYPVDNQVVEATFRDRDMFRDPEALVVLVSADADDGIFTLAGLSYVSDLTEQMRAVTGVRSDDVVSLSTILDVTRSTEQIHLTRFLDPMPRTTAEVLELRVRLDRGELYQGILYGTDGRSAAIYVPLVRDHPRGETIRRARSLIQDAPHPPFHARLAGPAVGEAMLGDRILVDLVRLVPLVVVVIAVGLFMCLRSASGAVIPLVAALAVLTWTFGSMALTRVPLTLVTSVLPVLLMAMAITDQIHLLERFRARFLDGVDRKQALTLALGDVGRPIVRTSITTALGFLSFTATTVVPMRHFGVFAGLGLIVAMAFTFTLVPAILMLLPRSWLGRAREAHDREPRGFQGWVARHPRLAVSAGLVLLIASLGGLPGVRIQDSWVQNFDPGSDPVVAEQTFNRTYRGSYRLDVMIESDADGVFRQPRGLSLVDSLEKVLAGFPEVGGTQSVASFARAGLRGVDPARSVHDLDEAGLAQLFLLLEMSGAQEQVDRLVTPSGRVARIQCFVPDADYQVANRLLDLIADVGTGLAADSGFRLRANGDLAIATEVVRATVVNQVRTVALTLAAIGIYLAISFRSVPIAAILLVPVAATTLLMFAGMGYLGIPLGVATSMFAALAEGEGTNFSIHLASRYLGLRARLTNTEAVGQTLDSTGAALRWNAIVLIAGILVLCLSALSPVRALGGLLAVGIAVSYLMAFLFVPALLARHSARVA